MNDLELVAPTITEELLKEFALAILKAPHNRDQEAMRICGGDYALLADLMEAASRPSFAAMLNSMRRNQSPSDRMPTKDEFCGILYDKLSEMRGDTLLKGMQLYAKLRGFEEAPPPTSGFTVNVIQVPQTPQGNNEQTVWESNAVSYSTELQRQGREINGNSE